MPVNQPIFYFDFGSPNAYLAWRVLPAIERRTGARFRMIPALLGGIFKATGNQSPMTAFAGIPAKLAYERREIERFVARHRLFEFRMNPHFPVNTLMLMRGAVAAEAEGVFDAYVAAAFHHMWEAPKKMDDPQTFGDAFRASRLPVDRIADRAQDPVIKDRLIANTQAAIDQGVFGLPSFIVGSELYFGKDRLEEIEAMLQPASVVAD
ncbi:2-hydroxychromene-2-carboxylate isomerase [Sphingomonas colocasiae]|uniref:2-hydroxychromene-2-carboxylate isomerase n=1 Tax=Sphingomonas colocasiae TaxID=1848973 RepID=A0ABS7PXS3_9SPHN|nr:2-hydroxychromene-2-carboxylate isomerase [Sphingomonas colocasiae]MBY8826152.1 2-hydroxychromene-2-carboxylate isomerase [Sphingomonas colocasiae]